MLSPGVMKGVTKLFELCCDRGARVEGAGVSRVGVGSGDGCEFDAVAEFFELSDEMLAAPVGLVFAGEVVRSELLVDGVLGEDVPADDQQRVRNGDQGALLTAPFTDALEPDSQIAVLGADPGPGGFDERGGEPRIPGPLAVSI